MVVKHYIKLREECGLKVFENSISKLTFGPNRNENGERRRLHGKEFRNLYCSLNKVRAVKYRIKMGKSCMKEGRSAFKILTGKPTGERSLGRPRSKWEDNIRMGLTKRDIGMRNWIDSVGELRLLESPCECGIGPPDSINFGFT